MVQLSRRNFMRGLGAGAVGLSVSTWFTIQPALAQGSTVVTAISRFKVGKFEVTAIQDTTFPLDPAIFAANADPAELTALLADNNIPDGPIKATVTVLLVNTGTELILLDTGNGAASGGNLAGMLALLGIGADAINKVIITHFHPDHIGGLTTNGKLNFPNAAVYFPQAELDFMDSAPADSPAASIIAATRTALQPAIDANTISYYAPDGEIVPGVTAVAAPGHTPGHSAVRIASEGEELLNMVDVALNNVVSLAHTEWYAGFDSIPELAAQTRQTMLAAAAEAGTKVFGYHFAFPGVGYIIAQGEGFEFVPVTA